MAFDKTKAWADSCKLLSSGSKRNAKYIRSINRYFYNGFRKDSIWTQDTYPMGYWTAANPSQMLADMGTLPSLNVVRSCLDTVKSKLSQSKPLPNFTPIRGTWKTRQVCRNAQIYFDDYFKTQRMYQKGAACALDAMLFEYAVVWADDEIKEIIRLCPWEFSFDPAEFNYGKPMRANVYRQDYPLAFLRDKIKKGGFEGAEKYQEMLEKDPAAKVPYTVYYNMYEKKQYKFLASDCIEERELKYDVIPFEMLWYRRPIKGWGSASMADSLMPIQEQIDRVAMTIHEALELNPANTIFVPQIAGSTDSPGAGIKASEFSNQIGNIYPYKTAPGLPASPVMVATPAPVDPMYIQLLDKFITFAYQMEGVSQLSAQSKKPSGVNSGVALDTLEDVESERFNSWLQDYIHFYPAIAELCIKVFPEDDDILPNRTGRAAIKWRDIVKERDSFNIQTSPVSNLSRDPKTKMEQIEKLMSMQIIKPAMAASLLEFADVDKAYSIASASYDDCQRIIERAIEKGTYDFYEVVDINQLYLEAVNTLMLLDADDEDGKVMENLVGFIVIVKNKVDMLKAATTPPPAPVPETVPAPVPPPVPLVQPAAQVAPA